MNESSRSQRNRNYREEAHNIVNTPHITSNDAQPSMMHDKGYMKLFMAKDDAYKNNTSKQS